MHRRIDVGRDIFDVVDEYQFVCNSEFYDPCFDSGTISCQFSGSDFLKSTATTRQFGAPRSVKAISCCPPCRPKSTCHAVENLPWTLTRHQLLIYRSLVFVCCAVEMTIYIKCLPSDDSRRTSERLGPSRHKALPYLLRTEFECVQYAVRGRG